MNHFTHYAAHTALYFVPVSDPLGAHFQDGMPREQRAVLTDLSGALWLARVEAGLRLNRRAPVFRPRRPEDPPDPYDRAGILPVPLCTVIRPGGAL